MHTLLNVGARQVVPCTAGSEGASPPCVRLPPGRRQSRAESRCAVPSFPPHCATAPADGALSPARSSPPAPRPPARAGSPDEIKRKAGEGGKVGRERKESPLGFSDRCQNPRSNSPDTEGSTFREI
eukprot:1191683-Prorocentrum_minimum.AAC.2